MPVLVAERVPGRDFRAMTASGTAACHRLPSGKTLAAVLHAVDKYADSAYQVTGLAASTGPSPAFPRRSRQEPSQRAHNLSIASVLACLECPLVLFRR